MRTIQEDHSNGAVGEYMVIIDMLKQGYNATLAPYGARFDILVDVGDKVLRIQVKTVAKQAKHAYNYKAYHFRSKNGYKPGEFDLIALVALDCNAIAYMLPEKFISQSAIRLQAPNHPKSSKRKQALNIDEFPFSQVLSQILSA